MNETLTLDEIHSRFVSEWVLLEDPETTPDLEIVRGKVLWHSADRDELYRKALELRPKHSAIVCTGEAPGDIILTPFTCMASP